ncbi:VOC family protein [Testudinibacter sp. TR-2022]|uniref:SMU1112c/YaeR family gloxylase I-like metalloprotein n=1 Tax=Testudinibacter sp. TR-2022 TaxID=2585029 RepID=UPI00111A0C0C|nr:VOC family protein [Testudinibacter sp. TR-2022]TNH04978.1 VOC family protein [Pasteurellaceae bacterium Phil31]TNH09329.1 VOC family protein [Testudinibacter sp. TR-2022]TNH09617.1 VOC family protein [Testudinibacter sp. TR-2022]TNH13488.1 VOC family protein [Testudinibacter sp. TR-2022]TNH19142.1 VOC family protein [Testudinibacter sp. TR-2022]
MTSAVVATPILGFDHVAIIVADYLRSKQFYCEILGARILAESYRAERQSYKLDLTFADGSQIELFSFPEPPARVSRPEACGLRHLAFKVDNIQSAVEYLAQHQIKCEPIRIDPRTGKQFTFFQDPDGLPLEFYSL